MATIQKFEEIICWKEARILCREMGLLIRQKKFGNNFRLIQQIEGSSGSIMDNIAEGFERGGNKELIQFLYIAKASCGELRSQLYRALDLDYLSQNEFDQLSEKAIKISYLIQRFIHAVNGSDLKGYKYKK